jgi:transcriptional regulator with GAF, ATPase, and Fis domain
MNTGNHPLPSQWSNWKDLVNGSRLPIPLNAALTEVEETTEMIHVEFEEAAELLYQRFQAVIDTVPAHLVLQNLLYQLLDCIRQVIAVDTVAVLLQTEDGQHLAVRATLGLEEEVTEGIQIPIGRGFAGCIAASCELRIVDDLSKVEVVSPILRNKRLKSMLGVPLLAKDRVIGVFHVGTVRSRQFTQDDARLMQLVADRMGLAIDRLAISRLCTTKAEPLVREKLALTCSRPKLSQKIRNFAFHHTGCLKLAPLPLPACF